MSWTVKLPTALEHTMYCGALQRLLWYCRESKVQCNEQAHNEHTPWIHAMCLPVASEAVSRQRREETSLCVPSCVHLAVVVGENTIFLPIKERTERGQLQRHGPVPCFSEWPVSCTTHSPSLQPHAHANFVFSLTFKSQGLDFFFSNM